MHSLTLLHHCLDSLSLAFTGLAAAAMTQLFSVPWPQLQLVCYILFICTGLARFGSADLHPMACYTLCCQYLSLSWHHFVTMHEPDPSTGLCNIAAVLAQPGTAKHDAAYKPKYMVRLQCTCRPVTRSWDCKKAAALLNLVVPVGPEPRCWAYPWLCIAPVTGRKIFAQMILVQVTVLAVPESCPCIAHGKCFSQVLLH